MSTLKGSKTEKNLMTAFAGESQARNRYTFYAGIASKEGHEGIANTFLETADNEKKHAHLFFKQLGGDDVEICATYPSKMGSTDVNLAASAAGEKEEWSAIYPSMAKTAEDEGFSLAAAIFRNIAGIEVAHEKRYRGLLERISNGTLYQRETPVAWKCIKCGHIHVGTSAPKICPTCAHPQGWFVPPEGQ